MSLYTPVFPQTIAPPPRTISSSSLTSTETIRRPPVLTYSSRLSQRHLAIAALPDELCPPSAPTSPTSRERSELLQSEIEQAVRDGRNISDFCKIRSTRFGYATTQPGTASVTTGLGQEDQDLPWILAETEEEWFEWERMMAERRFKLKGKERAMLVPSDTKSQNSLEKVLSWKASLQPLGSSPVTASTTQPVSHSQTPLGFPVVKRSSVLKESKLKKSGPASREDIASRRATAEQHLSQNDVEKQTAVHCVDAKTVNTTNVNISDAGLNKPTSGAERFLSNPVSVSRGDVLIKDSNKNRQSVLPDLSNIFPSSFPSDLPTSTPKDTVATHELDKSLPLSFPSNLPTSTPKDTVVGNQAQISVAELEQLPQIAPVSSIDRQGIESKFAEEPLHLTPPSPPDSSANSPEFTPMFVGAPRPATAAQGPTTPPNKQVRPLTPLSEDGAPAPFTVHNHPRTPERQPLKKHRTTPSPYGVATFTNGPTTPDSQINGAAVIRKMPFPRTPDRHVAVDLLASSRKSIPRPRPPSRKQLPQHLGADDAGGETSEEGGAHSPAKSDRSYFSSPASGDSSGSSRGSTNHVPDLPASPLGFTQSPGRFAPLGASTQQASPKAQQVLDKPTNSQIAVLRGQSQRTGSSQRNIVRASSGLLGMTYNSQFDVDAQVNQLSNFLEQDVDFGAWVRDTDDEDDDEVAVEKLTFAASPVGA
ncbi:hypothetical protein DFH11DRAFT_1852162 [Phellopilus nigrolimitatus]|nr:hypothetical protein DFH11DRAFT_1852162 [Phellopilus nigrolimitatus]